MPLALTTGVRQFRLVWNQYSLVRGVVRITERSLSGPAATVYNGIPREPGALTAGGKPQPDVLLLQQALAHGQYSLVASGRDAVVRYLKALK